MPDGEVMMCWFTEQCCMRKTDLHLEETVCGLLTQQCLNYATLGRTIAVSVLV